MASVNKAIIVGNLGDDPEIREVGETSVCKLRIATSRKYKDRSDDWVEDTQWHSVVVWGKQGENCKEYLGKGSPVYVEGRLQTRSWETDEGEKKYKTEIVAQVVQFLGRRSSGDDF